ncbi:hypothetical protein TCAL_06795 [Tigriopus californicus]|uniref:glutamyl aminopeptidase n=1 Tax=Tigriopus californicus TaxID=6832 RepID=A0A553PM06_TIGCA|nr:hypothetical protein TCAL_06795 [Tigriopus californicus]
MRSLVIVLVLIPGLLAAPDFDYPFAINRPKLVTLGEQVEVSCNVGSQLKYDTSICTFTNPDSEVLTLNVETGEVTHENRGDVTGYKAFGDENRCGLNITSIQQKDIGQWACHLPKVEPQVFDHKGKFNILTAEEDHVNKVRLPRHLIPSHYDVSWAIHLENETNPVANGHVGIDLKFDVNAQDQKQVTLHSKQLLIKEDTIVVKRMAEQPDILDILSLEYDLEREFLTMHLKDILTQGDYRVEMEFDVALQDDMRGLYRSSYKENGQTKYLAATQFEKTDARKAFPCLDEPNMKATFNVTIDHHKNLTAVSNMPLTVGESTIQDFSQSKGVPTPIMSTYLLAILVSDFESTKSPSEEDFLQVYHMKSKKGQADLAAKAGTDILRFYEQYFAIDYEIPKMDMAAIPDFDAGAMENWGLITYRESRLLYQEGLSAKEDQDAIVEVIAHELSHQWFGNLVTMDWWTDLWLNEGFATYMEYIGANSYLPDNQKQERAVLNDLHDVLGIDSLKSAVPISVEVGNPYYDFTYTRLAYGKGGCLLRMVEAFMTLDTFKEGVNQYLKGNNHGNTVREDLWQSLNNVAELESIDISTVMEGFTKKEGYPVITVDEVNEKTLTLSQKRFYINSTAEESTFIWFVPISVAYPEWFMEDDPTIELNVNKVPYVLNAQQTGYFRVNYDAENWLALTDELKNDPNNIHLLNRAQIMDDSFNLARAKQLEYSTPLDMTEYLTKEKEYVPLQAALNNLNYLDLMLRKSNEDYKAFQNFVRGILDSKYENFATAPSDTLPQILFKETVNKWLCSYGHQNCINAAKSQFQHYMQEHGNNSATIDPNFKQLVFQVAIQNGGNEEFEFLLNQLENVQLDQDTVKILRGLGASEDEANLKKILDISIATDSIIRAQDIFYLYAQISKSAVGGPFQFQWLEQNFPEVKAKFGSSFGKRIVNLLGGFMAAANTEPEIEELKEFIRKHYEDIGSGISDLNQGIDKAETNLKWVQESQIDVQTWLEEGGFYESGDDGGGDDENAASGHEISLTILCLGFLFLVLGC